MTNSITNQEVAGIRLVLVHTPARLPRSEIQAISESINRAWSSELEKLAALDAEQAESSMGPYRDAADEILAHAVRISESQC